MGYQILCLLTVLLLVAATAPITAFADSSPAAAKHLGAKHRQPVHFNNELAGGPATASLTPLQFGGGSVLVSPKVYISWWGSQWSASSSVQSYIKTFFSNVGGSAWAGQPDEYCEGVGSGTTSCPAGATFLGNPTGVFQAGNDWSDTTAVGYSTPLSSCSGGTDAGDCDVMAAVQRLATHFGSPAGALYFVFTPPGQSQPGFGSSWCAYHASVNSMPFAYMPYQPDAGAACGSGFVAGNPNPTWEGFTLVGGHEFSEAVTDPLPTSGWFDPNDTTTGGENADKCAWSLGTANGGSGSQNISLAGQTFAVQPLWSNRAGHCTLAYTAPSTTSVGPLYTLDGYGGVHPAGASQGLPISGYWPGWDIARGIALFHDGSGGYTLDGWGGVHPIGSGTPTRVTTYWPGWDIARGIVMAPWAAPGNPAGWVLDGWGGLHPFGNAPEVRVSAYWPGWDIARSVVITSDSTAQNVKGYVLDGWGALHEVGNAPHVDPAAYWPGWDIARAAVLVPTSSAVPAGYAVDGWGGLHAFGSAPGTPASGGYWPGSDIARGAAVWSGSTPGSPGGWVVRGDGGLYRFGSAPAVASNASYPWIGRGAAGG